MDTASLSDILSACESMKPMIKGAKISYIPIIATATGVLIGVLVSNSLIFLRDICTEKKKKETISKSLIAEVESIQDIIKQREYLDSLKEIIKELSNNPREKHRYAVKVSEKYSQVYQSQLENIGLLDKDLAVSIVKFHQLLDAVVQDVTPGGSFSEEEGQGIEAFKELHGILQQAIQLGDNLTDK